MATFVWLQNDVDAINMDKVIKVEPAANIQGAVAVEFDNGRVTLYRGDQARRIMAWLADNAALPVLLPTGDAD